MYLMGKWPITRMWGAYSRDVLLWSVELLLQVACRGFTGDLDHGKLFVVSSHVTGAPADAVCAFNSWQSSYGKHKRVEKRGNRKEKEKMRKDRKGYSEERENICQFFLQAAFLGSIYDTPCKTTDIVNNMRSSYTSLHTEGLFSVFTYTHTNTHTQVHTDWSIIQLLALSEHFQIAAVNSWRLGEILCVALLITFREKPQAFWWKPLL